jgi:hypothetical protein
VCCSAYGARVFVNVGKTIWCLGVSRVVFSLNWGLKFRDVPEHVAVDDVYEVCHCEEGRRGNHGWMCVTVGY